MIINLLLSVRSSRCTQVLSSHFVSSDVRQQGLPIEELIEGSVGFFCSKLLLSDTIADIIVVTDVDIVARCLSRGAHLLLRHWILIQCRTRRIAVEVYGLCWIVPVLWEMHLPKRRIPVAFSRCHKGTACECLAAFTWPSTRTELILFKCFRIVVEIISTLWCPMQLRKNWIILVNCR